VLGSCLEKGIDVKGKGKSELQDILTGKKDTEGTTTVTNTNLDKFKKSWLKSKSYYYSMDSSEKDEASNFIQNNPFYSM
jgi:hypothetical protein